MRLTSNQIQMPPNINNNTSGAYKSDFSTKFCHIFCQQQRKICWNPVRISLSVKRDSPIRSLHSGKFFAVYKNADFWLVKLTFVCSLHSIPLVYTGYPQFSLMHCLWLSVESVCKGRDCKQKHMWVFCWVSFAWATCQGQELTK